jgi:excisionase family DNA binding protein
LDTIKSPSNCNKPTHQQGLCAQCVQEERFVDAKVASRLRSMEPFVTTAAVAKFLGLSRRTVAKMAREGRIPAHPVSGTARRTWRFKLSEVEVSLVSQLPHPILSERPDCSAESE